MTTQQRMKIKDIPRAIGEIELPTKAEVRRAGKRHVDAFLIVLLTIAAFPVTAILLTLTFQLAGGR